VATPSHGRAQPDRIASHGQGTSTFGPTRWQRFVLPPKGLLSCDIYIPDLHIDAIKVKVRNSPNQHTCCSDCDRRLS
jgi:hypothetical protein